MAISIVEMNRAESLAVLGSTHLGHLACVRDGVPYVVPVYFAFEGGFLYGVSAPGKKIDWMRANPAVCLSVEDMVATREREWASVVVDGTYQELNDSGSGKADHAAAKELLRRNTMWWEPQHIRDGLVSGSGTAAILFRIKPLQIAGRQAVRASR